LGIGESKPPKTVSEIQAPPKRIKEKLKSSLERGGTEGARAPRAGRRFPFASNTRICDPNKAPKAQIFGNK
jgi:hypothetical protein